jgi:hypothetical protein
MQQLLWDILNCNALCCVGMCGSVAAESDQQALVADDGGHVDTVGGATRALPCVAHRLERII